MAGELQSLSEMHLRPTASPTSPKTGTGWSRCWGWAKRSVRSSPRPRRIPTTPHAGPPQHAPLRLPEPVRV